MPDADLFSRTYLLLLLRVMGCASSVLSPFDANKCKMQLKLLDIRLGIKIKKEANAILVDKREVAALIEGKHEERARILVESVIRRDYNVETMELLKLEAGLLLNRVEMIANATDGSLAVEFAQMVCTIVYCAYIMSSQIEELKALGNMFKAKYGSAFMKEVQDNPVKYIHERLFNTIQKAGTTVFDPFLVEAYMVEIAKLKEVEYTPKAPPGDPPVEPPSAPKAAASADIPMGVPIQVAGPNGTTISIPVFYPVANADAPNAALQAELAAKLGLSPDIPTPMLASAAANRLGLMSVDDLGTSLTAQIKAAHTKLCGGGQ